MSKYIELSRALMYIADIQLSVSDVSKPTIAPRDLCEWIFEGIKDLPTIEVSEEVLKATKNFNAYTIADENAEMGMRTQIEPIIEVSEDCISRGWLEQEIEDILVESKFEDECLEIRGWNSALDTVVAIIEKAPSVVPSRAEGEWLPIIEGNEFGEVYQVGIYCSECGETLGCEANYCPNCGADMRGEEE